MTGNEHSSALDIGRDLTFDLQEEARRAHYAAESAVAVQKEAAKELEHAKEAAAQARAAAEETRSRATRESERADAAERQRKAAVLEREELSGKLAIASRDLEWRVQHEHLSNEVPLELWMVTSKGHCLACNPSF